MKMSFVLRTFAFFVFVIYCELYFDYFYKNFV